VSLISSDTLAYALGGGHSIKQSVSPSGNDLRWMR